MVIDCTELLLTVYACLEGAWLSSSTFTSWLADESAETLSSDAQQNQWLQLRDVGHLVRNLLVMVIEDQ